MGYPIIVTPVSQLVATQALRNVVDEERWSNVSIETIRYFLGHYGDPAAPVDPEVAERVLSRPGVDELRDLEPLHLEDFRRQFGKRMSDEELLLRATMPEEQVDAMVAARGSTGSAGRQRHPVTTLLREVARRNSVVSLHVRTADRVVEWHRAS
jgi:oxaloacetate decarboxylase alpha subunit